jgi:hypothetical protein
MEVEMRKMEEATSKPRQKRSNGWKLTRNQSQYKCGKSLVSVAEINHFHHGPGIALSTSRPAIPGQSAKTVLKRGRIKTTMLLSEDSATAFYQALRDVIESARSSD